MLNLAVLLEDSARTHPSRSAIVAEEMRLSYREVDDLANRVANLLVEHGVNAGDRIALSCPNVPWYPVAYYGILKAGAVVVPLNVLLREREIAYHLHDSGARILLCFVDSDQLEAGDTYRAAFAQSDDCEAMFMMTGRAMGSIDAEHLEGEVTLDAAITGQSSVFDTVPTEATDTAVVLYTSGTTGHPKGAELTHANLVLNALTAFRALDGREAQDVHLVALPLFHAFGQTLQMHTAFAGANTLVLMERFRPDLAVQLLLQERVTHFSGVPTIYHGLLSAIPGKSERDAIRKNLRVALAGGAPMPVALTNRVREEFGIDVREGYGLSETSPGACFTIPQGGHGPGSIGRPLWGVEMKLIQPNWDEVPTSPDSVGEIAIKGHPVMKGYLNRPEDTALVLRDGWFRTGDLARRDALGNYYIVDRAKDLIIRGGYNVYPRELEEVFMTHPAVSMVAVVGVPDSKLGQEVVAYVQKTPGDSTTADELFAWAKEQFASYKYPRRIEMVDEFSMTATGKILKRALGENP